MCLPPENVARIASAVPKSSHIVNTLFISALHKQDENGKNCISEMAAFFSGLSLQFLQSLQALL
jgi:hypothetical protein